jgi:hypothetical protein
MSKSIMKIFSFITCAGIIFGILFWYKGIQGKDNKLYLDSRIDFLWQNTVHKMLQEPLWQERDAMMHATF